MTPPDRENAVNAPPQGNEEKIVLHFDETHQVATLVIDNSMRRNALSEAMMCLGQDLVGHAAKQGARVLIVRGAGRKVFSSGYDLTELQLGLQQYSQRGVEADEHPLNRLLDALERYEGITIAHLNGDVIGAGALIAVACDLRYGATGTQWVVPAARFGVVYPQRGVRALAALAGFGRAIELVASGLPIESQEAARWGLVNRVFPPESLSAEVERLARMIAANAPLPVLAAKMSARSRLSVSLDPELQARLDQLTAQSLHSRDLQEGMDAWRSKREPKFTGE